MHQEFFASSRQHVKLEGRSFLFVPNEGGLRVKRVDGFRERRQNTGRLMVQSFQKVNNNNSNEQLYTNQQGS